MLLPKNTIDIYRMLPEGTRCEVLHNQLTMVETPGTDHQFISVKLSALLYNYLEETEKGVILHAPADVYFEQEQSVLQPDVLVILNENKSIIHKDGIYGAPDIVFEIL
jgi:Uma2 family endonuclease